MGRPKRSGAAAFFDLDRTLLRGASGPVISKAMKAAGLLPDRANPLEPLIFGLFDLIGENRPTMMLTRQAARVAKGWPRATVAAIGDSVAPQLEAMVLPYARAEIEMHRAAGRRLVLATTTPRDLVAPLAARLGFDDLIATRYGGDETTFHGTIDGEFVWGKAKARSVQAFAAEHDIDLAESHAYSDSYYDVPLLSIVGSPHAINPDPRMAAVAALRRWPITWFDVPVGVPKVAGLEPQTALLAVARPELFAFARFRIYGHGRVPSFGPAILVANHRSYFDPVAIAMMLGKVGRPVRFLGKKEVFDAPIVGDLARAMGGIRVDRGTGSSAPIKAAEDALAAGELVAIMPQGTIPRGLDFFDPELKGRWGAAKLAAATGAPVIPIGLWGTERVWPRSSKFPLVHQLLNPPAVTIRVGRPIALDGADLDADTSTMMAAITELLPAAARRRHDPTPEELALTSP